MELKDQIKAALEKKRPEVAQAKKAFEDARAAAKETGILTDDGKIDSEGFKKLDDLQKVWGAGADEQKQMEAQLVRMYELEHETAPDRPNEKSDEPQKPAAQSPGERVVNSASYKTMISSGVLDSGSAQVRMDPVKAMDRAELKALITGLADASGGAFVQSTRLPGMLGLLQRPLRVANLVTVSQTDSDTVEWVKQDSFTNAAAEVLEATSVSDGAKPESAMAFSVVSSIVQQIAHWVPVTRRALADASQLSGLIDQQLRLGVDQRLDSQMINGNGSTPNLRGILNVSGIGTQAMGADSRVDAIHKAITTIRLAFLEPNAIIIHPSDWEQLVLEKNANADYYYGGPTQSNAATVWGLTVVPSTVIAAGTALVGDFSQAVLWIREGVRVLMTDSHSDFFVRNILVLLAEMRAAFGVPRPAAFATVTGI